MVNCIFSNKAIDDLDSIWLYTFENWSEQQADIYYNEIVNACQSICSSKINTDREYNEIRKGLWCRHCHKHLIFYKYSSENTVEIIRILHERMDIENIIY